ncbi:hypothetical protein [Roseibium aggregatum]|uniref:Secreted protein n=1 Tax=Roseibium aggregatum TaxID=187304 RepID=A0A939EF56_9HYPH|nr:hypothetical protein [Roseibium aggregatum]MBN9671018.1 hypothetical protein [Roseibium aggregatum]
MRKRSAKSVRRRVLGLLAGALTAFAVPSFLAADSAQPTYLQSGDNDLIEFQRGGVPGADSPADDAIRPAPMARPAKSDPARDKTQSVQGYSSEAPAGRLATTPAPQAEAASPETAFEEDLASDALEDAGEGAREREDEPAEIDARLVTVCLTNPRSASGDKAFDIRRDGPPRFVAAIGATSCARFEPTQHTLYLWKTNDGGKLALILSSPLDLNESDGTKVTLDWVRDR